MKQMPAPDDPFARRSFSPMLFKETEPFNSEDYIFELKLDGIRCFAYLDKNETTLINKRGKNITPNYPELSALHEQCKNKAIIDGELVCFTEGKPDFYPLQRRSLMTDKLKIKLTATRHPGTFVAFDILYGNGNSLIDQPLIKRKKILSEYIKENNKIAVTKYIETNGTAFFKLAKKQNLEGVVAKEKKSRYYPGKRSGVWLKIKVYREEDLIISGYLAKENGSIDLILTAFNQNGKLIPIININTKKDKTLIRDFAKKYPAEPLFADGSKSIIWIKPYLVGTVKYMMKTPSGNFRQPVFKGVRTDKFATDLIKQ